MAAEPRNEPRNVRKPATARKKRTLGTWVALGLSIVFALVGVVPMAFGILVRTPSVQRWAADKTSALIDRELHVAARYKVEIKPWPLSLVVSDLTVDATDGGSPFASAELVSVRPGIFSLFAGKLDLGQVQVTGARVRAVVREGKLVNLDARTKPSATKTSLPDDLPLSSISITDASLDLDLDGTLVSLREIDADLDKGERSYDIALRTGAGALTRVRPFPGRPDQDAVDEDQLCHFDARADIDDQGMTVRRLALVAAVDFDPDPGTRPPCDLSDGDWRKVDLRLSGVRIGLSNLPVFAPPASTSGAPSELPPTKLRSIEGMVAARVPVSLVHRFVPMAHATGALDLDVEARWSPENLLPIVRGKLRADTPGIDGKIFSSHFQGDVDIAGSVVRVTHIQARWANGDFTIPEVEIRPFDLGIPLEARGIVGEGVELEGLLRDLGAHPQAHVGWKLVRTEIPRFGGTIVPLSLEGPLASTTRDFGVYDRPARRPDRRRMVSVEGGDVKGLFTVRPDAVVLKDMHLVTARSTVSATVKLGFDDEFGLDVGAGTVVDLSELTPIVTVPIGGLVSIDAHGTGTFGDPHITGDVSIKGFSLGGFDAGEIRHAKAKFAPLKLELSDLELVRGDSFVTSSNTVVDFESGADVLVEADVDTTRGPGLAVHDFLQVFKLDNDVRFSDLEAVARGTARVRFTVGGPDDRCGGGALSVRATTKLSQPTLLGEIWDEGALDMRFDWADKAAGGEGMSIDVYSASLRDGTGSVLAKAEVRPGGILRGNVIASGLSLGRLESVGALGKLVDGEVSAVGTLGGKLSAMEAHLDVSVSPLRVGPEMLPASRFQVVVEPVGPPPKVVSMSRCQNPIGEPWTHAEWERDLETGRVRLNGSLFDGQVRLEDLTLSRQRSTVVRGKAFLSDLDLGKLANLVPGIAFSGRRVEGKVSAEIDMTKVTPSDLAHSDATLELFDLHLDQGGRTVELDEASDKIVLKEDVLTVPELKLVLKDKSGLSIGFAANGGIQKVFTEPVVDAGFTIAPFDLAKLKGDVDSIERIAGKLSGNLAVKGPLGSPRYAGAITLRGGALAVTGSPLALDDAMVDISIGAGELRVVRASANVGSGTLDLTGRVPLVGLGFGAASANITARNVKMPIADGIDITANADLVASYKPDSSAPSYENLPNVQGTVQLQSFSYARPIALNISDLQKTFRKPVVESYDPTNDVVSFDVTILSPRPLRIENDLVDLRLEIEDPGLELSGTNQRFGARGNLRVLPDSKLHLRNHEFDVREGFVRFEDPSKVKAEVDVRAVTELRRYAGADQATGTDAASTTGGQWDITLRAHGETDDLKLDLTSDPTLDQEDIVLLLTVGMTRAELDRSLASGFETVGLEALSALTGADKAVKSVVPIIDYFHFGSNYSSRTGRTEPNVTVGKRVTDDVNASVTTSLTQREVGATLEWRLKKGVSVQTSYDNESDVNSSVGNLGADLRWRLEFE